MYGQTRSQCMGNSQCRRQHYITYYGYTHSLPSVAGFIRQSGDYYLFPPLEISAKGLTSRYNSALVYCEIESLKL